jgi:predicted PurR-regulated permease PerM
MNNHRGGLLGLVLGGVMAEASTDSIAAKLAPPIPTKGLTAGDTTRVAPPIPTTPSAATGQQKPDSISLPATLRQRVGSGFSGATRYLFPFLHSTIEIVSGFLIIVFLSIYIAADPEMYRRGLMHLFPHKQRARAGEVLSSVATVLRKWLVTQLIAMVAIGTVMTVILAALGVKAALALGVLGGLLEFIPTIGPIMSALPAIAMGFVDSPEKALWVALAYWGVQFFENHLLIPLLMKGGMDLPPALTIMAQALMALLFGFLGLMCAVPMLAAVMVAVKMLYVEGVVGDKQKVPTGNPQPVVE